ncbi:unnamed protein product, partial [Rotaria magnacalcarata]
GEEFNRAGVRRPSPNAINTELISKMPRANERSLGVEQAEEEEEPTCRKEKN